MNKEVHIDPSHQIHWFFLTAGMCVRAGFPEDMETRRRQFSKTSKELVETFDLRKEIKQFDPHKPSDEGDNKVSFASHRLSSLFLCFVCCCGNELTGFILD